MPKATRWAEFLRLAAIETDECVLWPHYLTPTGYPQMNVNIGNGVFAKFPLHRWALIFRVPPPLPKALACHKPGIGCSRACINYRHLRWDDYAGNYADQKIDGTYVRGIKVSHCKLTVEQVREIRALRAAGVPENDVAERFNVSKGSVGNIHRRATWAWLD